jgi:hypothetical protein
MAVIESMGPLTNWGKEHLGVADVVIIGMRESLVRAVKRFVETGEVAEADPSIPFDRVRGDHAVIPADAPWQAVGAHAGEYEPALR